MKHLAGFQSSQGFTDSQHAKTGLPWGWPWMSRYPDSPDLSRLPRRAVGLAVDGSTPGPALPITAITR